MAGNGRANGRPGIPTALIYTRVSTDEQAREGLSLPAQLADTRRYVAGLGWIIGNEYQDVLSGRRDDRPQYQALLSEIRNLRSQGQSVAVVVKWLDRFGRSVMERAKSAQELRRLGVPIHSVMEGGQVSDFVYNILAAVAEEEVRKLGERVSAVRQHAVANGWHFPGKVSWGFRWRERTEQEKALGAPKSVLDMDSATSPYLREAFHRVYLGATIQSIVRWAARLPSEARGGRRLNHEAVRRILMAPVYVARPETGDPDILSRPRAHSPALVDDATFARVQERLASHKRLPHQASGRYLLTGFIRCPRCGLRMTGRARRGHSSAYACNAKTYGAAAPNPDCGVNVVVPAVDATVLAEVERLLDAVTQATPGLHDAVRRAWQSEAEPVDDAVRLMQQLERASEKARQRLTTAAQMLVDGDLDKVGYDLLRDKARADLDAAEAESSRLRNRIPSPVLPGIDTVLEEAGGWSRVIRESDVSGKREVLALLIDRISPMRVGRGVYQAQIEWTPLGQALRTVAGVA